MLASIEMWSIRLGDNHPLEAGRSPRKLPDLRSLPVYNEFSRRGPKSGASVIHFVSLPPEMVLHEMANCRTDAALHLIQFQAVLASPRLPIYYIPRQIALRTIRLREGFRNEIRCLFHLRLGPVKRLRPI